MKVIVHTHGIGMKETYHSFRISNCDAFVFILENGGMQQASPSEIQSLKLMRKWGEKDLNARRSFKQKTEKKCRHDCCGGADGKRQ